MTDSADPAQKIRRATPADTPACHGLLWEAATDLGNRRGTPLEGTAEDWWGSMEPVHRLMEREAAEWWVAEGSDGNLNGFARSFERGSIFELTELFVKPGDQSRGLGRALVERAFPAGRGDLRVIIASTDERALTLYYTADTMARFPIFTLAGEPHRSETAELDAIRVQADPADLAHMTAVEEAVLGQGRSAAELEWLSGHREGYLYRRAERVVGFAFVGAEASGPVVALEPADLPAILIHVESRAHELGVEKLELEVPSVNTAAIEHLSQRGFRIDPWINLLMSNRPFGQFDRFIGFGPPIFL
ncbi:MAG TPA: GNAT family N-acetyltransferase [Candidatus Limnocylindrales bacterium]|nr:GNAT family N-acetyltransferase [Candidatus Limnocylindrales bacterium]